MKLEETVQNVLKIVQSLRTELRKKYPACVDLNEQVPPRSQLSIHSIIKINEDNSETILQREGDMDPITAVQAIINLTTWSERYLPLGERVLKAIDSEFGVINIAAVIVADWMSSILGQSDIERFQADYPIIKQCHAYLFRSSKTPRSSFEPYLEIMHETLPLWILFQTHANAFLKEIEWYIEDEGPFEKIVVASMNGRVSPALYRSQRDRLKASSQEIISNEMVDCFKTLTLSEQIRILEYIATLEGPAPFDIQPLFNEFDFSMQSRINKSITILSDDLIMPMIVAHQADDRESLQAILSSHIERVNQLLADIEPTLQRAQNISWESQTEKSIIIREQLQELNSKIRPARFINLEHSRNWSVLPRSYPGWVAYFQQPLLKAHEKQALSLCFDRYELESFHDILFYLIKFLSVLPKEGIDSAIISQLYTLKTCYETFVSDPSIHINLGALGPKIDLISLLDEDDTDDENFFRTIGTSTLPYKSDTTIPCEDNKEEFLPTTSPSLSWW